MPKTIQDFACKNPYKLKKKSKSGGYVKTYVAMSSFLYQPDRKMKKILGSSLLLISSFIYAQIFSVER